MQLHCVLTNLSNEEVKKRLFESKFSILGVFACGEKRKVKNRAKEAQNISVR
jgi:hypothetical protein